MTTTELAEHIAKKVAFWEEHRLSGEPQMTLVVGTASPPRGERVRLCGRSGPLGEVLCVNSKGETVALFSCVKVLAWLAKRPR